MLVRKYLRVAFWIISSYFISWTLIYMSAMGWNFEYFVEYFLLVWSGEAGEIPGLIQLYAIILTAFILLLMGVFYMCLKFRHRIKERSG